MDWEKTRRVLQGELCPLIPDDENAYCNEVPLHAGESIIKRIVRLFSHEWTYNLRKLCIFSKAMHLYEKASCILFRGVPHVDATSKLMLFFMAYQLAHKVEMCAPFGKTYLTYFYKFLLMYRNKCTKLMTEDTARKCIRVAKVINTIYPTLFEFTSDNVNIAWPRDHIKLVAHGVTMVDHAFTEAKRNTILFTCRSKCELQHSKECEARLQAYFRELKKVVNVNVCKWAVIELIMLRMESWFLTQTEISLASASPLEQHLLDNHNNETALLVLKNQLEILESNDQRC
jgi:hypothetical protein